jgi:flagellar protein FliJ
MSFKYRFDRVMKIAEYEKKELEALYNDVYNLLEDQGKKLIELMKRKEKIQAQFERKKRDKVTVSLMMEQSMHLNQLGQYIQDEQVKYEQLRIRVEELRPVLMEKSVEHKKLEKLKDHHWMNYQEKEKMLENKKMDEVAMQNHLKQ